MDARLIGMAVALFFAAYAETTPLFLLFGVKADCALALAVLAAFSFESFRECALLALAGACGLAMGGGFIPSILFFAGVFTMARAAYRAIPWQPFLVGCTLVIFFSFLTYVSADWALVMRLAPQFAREALYNVIAFAGLYLLVPSIHARNRRYKF